MLDKVRIGIFLLIGLLVANLHGIFGVIDGLWLFVPFVTVYICVWLHDRATAKEAARDLDSEFAQMLDSYKRDR